MTGKVLNILLLLYAVFQQTSAQTGDPVVSTNYGDVLGHTSTVTIHTGEQKQLTKFLGIPYAKPPIDELRFQRPQRPDSWNDTFDATVGGHGCFEQGVPSGQNIAIKGEDSKTFTQSEDCLILNIYYPGSVDEMVNSSKAVMVFIHGGGYVTGGANYNDGSILALTEDVIVVIMNYRMGIFGFASTPDGVIPGNMGLFDQHQALIWVQENIAHFGGNSMLVTVFGTSGGADSINTHLSSPLSNGLFQRAIIQSSYGDDKINKTEQFDSLRILASVISSCSIDSTSSELLECMQDISADELNNINDEVGFASYMAFPLVFDGVLITEDPITIFTEGRYNTAVDVIIGFNADDGDSIIKILGPMGFDSLLNGISQTEAIQSIEALFPVLFGHPYGQGKNDELLLDLITSSYFSGTMTPLEAARSYLDFWTHNVYGSFAISLASTLANAGTQVYFYYFDYRAESNLFVLDNTVQGGLQLSGVHTEEMFYVFGNAASGTERDRTYATSIMRAWAQFAKTGQPSSNSLSDMFSSWTTYNQNTQYYMPISTNTNYTTDVLQMPVEFTRFTQFFRNTINTVGFGPDKYIIVNTNYGGVIGATSDDTDPNRAATRFYGVPYAKPPVGDMRFKKPEAPHAWADSHLATEYANACFQLGIPENEIIYNLVDPDYSYKMHEDCLYLNIHYPGNFVTSNNDRKAVMVFIHGGAYAFGSANEYYGHTLAKDQDVIVVAMNYRLGFLGFGNTADSIVPANLGLHDQLAALIWIKDNIAHFGGNPSLITIFGESAGAESVVNHVASPMSDGLFSRAIMQSPYSTPKPHAADQYQMWKEQAANTLGCSSVNSAQDFLNCLQNYSGYILTNSLFLPEFQYVSIDGEFLPDDPVKMFYSGRFNTSVDIMIGYCADDGVSGGEESETIVTEGINSTDKALQDFINVYLPYILGSEFTDIPNSNIMLSIINELYFKGKIRTDEISRGLINSITDYFFRGISIYMADLISLHGANVYLFEFDYRSQRPEFQFIQNTLPGLDLSATHGEDLFYMFGLPVGLRLPGTDVESLISYSMMNAWGEFAKTGIPIYFKSDSYPEYWMPYTQLMNHYFHIVPPLTNASGSQLVSEDIQIRIQFWMSTLKDLNRLPNVEIIQFDGTNGNQDSDVGNDNTEDNIFDLSLRMSQILLIMACCGLLFFLLLSVILLCYVFSISRKR